jgi:hypothetical protein
MVLLLISLVLSFSYIIFIKYKFDVSSISASHYKFQEQKKGREIIFQLWTIVTGFTLLPCWLEVTPDNYQFVAYLSAVFLAVVGCFPQYKDKDSFLHPVFAIICATLALIWGCLSGVWFIPVICIGIALIIARNGKLFWMEVGAILSIYGSIFLKLWKTEAL